MTSEKFSFKPKLKSNIGLSIRKDTVSIKLPDGCKAIERPCIMVENRQQDINRIGHVSFASGDIEWKWSSPPPAVSSMRGVMEKTPLHHMKTQCKSISPISDVFPRKRKLPRSETTEHEYSALLEDEESCLLVQCSQEVEASLSGQASAGKHATTPRRHSRALEGATTTVPLPKGRVHSNREVEDNNLARVHCSSTRSIETKAAVGPAQESVPVVKCAYEINDSYDDLLMTFCDENIELLSQPLPSKGNENKCKQQQCENSNESKDKLQTLSCQSTNTVTTITTITTSSKATVQQDLPTNLDVLFVDGALDDDFLQPDLLRVLESVERTSKPEAHTAPPMQCTPQEIEQKRLQAKIKLQRKKSTTFNEINRLPYIGVIKR